MRLEERIINYVRDAIDYTVGQTGYPCVGVQLELAGVADRKTLRALTKRGHLKTVDIKHNNGKLGRGTQYKAYYTERVTPVWLLEQTKKKTFSIEGTEE